MKIACYNYGDTSDTIKVFAFDDDVAQDILLAARDCGAIKSGSLVNGVLLYGQPAVVKLKVVEYANEYDDPIKELKKDLLEMDTYLFSTEILANNLV